MSTVKWNNAAVTPEGFNLQAELLQGGGIEFTRVTGADADGNNKITLSMQPSTVTNARITVPVLLSNTSLSEGFQMTQLRFYAKGTGGAPEYEILYAVAQDAEGDYIPSSSESPGFTIDWSYTFQFGNADNVTVELDPAGLVSFSTVGQPNGVAPLGADGKIPDEYLDGTAGSSIAPPYDPESTYDQGDYCTYNGALYQANVDIDTPEAWNESHWTAVSVTEQFIPNTEKGAASGVATLDTSGKLTPNQKPSYTAAEVGADEEGSAAEVQTNLSAHTGNTNNPHSVTAAQVGAIPLSQKGAPGGVAPLDEDGKVPAVHLRAMGGSLLTTTFDEAFAGLPYTITGGAESYSGIVPESLQAVHNLLAVNTAYTLTVEYGEVPPSRTITTGEWFTAIEESIAPFAATITVTTEAGSTVTCAKGDKTMTQTATEGTAIFTVGETGTWTLTSVNEDKRKSIEVIINEDGEQKNAPIFFQLKDYTWGEIAAISESGKASEYFQLGDAKDVEINGIGTMTMEIAAFDHDYLSGATNAEKAGISFLTRRLLPDNYPMTGTQTHFGQFNTTSLYTTLTTTIWNALPEELRNVVKMTFKWYGDGGNDSGGWTGMKIWLPLEFEMFGETNRAIKGEQTIGGARQYPIFTDNESRVKKKNVSGFTASYWTASPCASSSTAYCTVNSIGEPDAEMHINGYGVCFGISI